MTEPTYLPDTPLSPAEYETVARFGLAPELRRPTITHGRQPWWWYPIQVLVMALLVVTAPVWIVALVVFVAYADRRIE